MTWTVVANAIVTASVGLASIAVAGCNPPLGAPESNLPPLSHGDGSSTTIAQKTNSGKQGDDGTITTLETSTMRLQLSIAGSSKLGTPFTARCKLSNERSSTVFIDVNGAGVLMRIHFLDLDGKQRAVTSLPPIFSGAMRPIEPGDSFTWEQKINEHIKLPPGHYKLVGSVDVSYEDTEIGGMRGEHVRSRECDLKIDPENAPEAPVKGRGDGMVNASENRSYSVNVSLDVSMVHRVNPQAPFSATLTLRNDGTTRLDYFTPHSAPEVKIHILDSNGNDCGDVSPSFKSGSGIFASVDPGKSFTWIHSVREHIRLDRGKYKLFVSVSLIRSEQPVLSRALEVISGANDLAIGGQ